MATLARRGFLFAVAWFLRSVAEDCHTYVGTVLASFIVGVFLDVE